LNAPGLLLLCVQGGWFLLGLVLLIVLVREVR